MLRIGGEREPVLALRLIGLVEFRERRGQAASGFDELRVEIEGRGETSARLRVPRKRRERCRAARHRLWIVGVNRQRPVEARERFLVAAERPQGRAEAEIGLRLVGVYRQ